MLDGMRDTPQPRWLDRDQQQAWMSLVGIMLRLPAALVTQLQRDAGISSFEYQVLSGLSTAPERTMRMSRLAALTEGSRPGQAPRPPAARHPRRVQPRQPRQAA